MFILIKILCWLLLSTVQADDLPLLGVGQGWSSPVWQWCFSCTNALPGDGSVTVNSPSIGGLVMDATSTLTFAGNNLIRSGASMATQTTDISLGTQNNYLLCATIPAGSSITLSGAYASAALTAANMPYKFTPSSAAALTMTVANTGGSPTNASLSAVTYEAACRAVDQVYNATDYFGPKIDYGKGLRKWDALVNYASYSADFTGWTNVGSTITKNAATAPDGTNSANKIVGNSGYNSPTPFIYLTPTGSNNVSIYIKAGEYHLARIIELGHYYYYATVDLNTGVISAVGGSKYLSSSSTNIGNGWWRIDIANSTSGTTPYSVVGFPDTATLPTNAPASYISDGISGLYAWGVQQVLGSPPGPYIPTGANPVTAAAESVTINSPLSTYLAAGPWAYSWTDGSTGVTTCTTGAAGAFSWPNNGTMKSIKVYPTGTSAGGVQC